MKRKCHTCHGEFEAATVEARVTLDLSEYEGPRVDLTVWFCERCYYDGRMLLLSCWAGHARRISR